MATPYRDLAMSMNPDGAWFFDETTGTVAVDETNTKDGEYFGATLAQPPLTGDDGSYSVVLDGVDDYVELYDGGDTSTATLQTHVVVFQLNATSGLQIICVHGWSSDDRQIGVAVEDGNFIVWNGSGGALTGEVVAPATTGVHMVAVQHNRSTNDHWIYVDGELEWTGNQNINFSSSGRIRCGVGFGAGGDSAFVNGNVDSYFWWEDVLAAQQVADLWDAATSSGENGGNGGGAVAPSIEQTRAAHVSLPSSESISVEVTGLQSGDQLLAMVGTQAALSHNTVTNGAGLNFTKHKEAVMEFNAVNRASAWLSDPIGEAAPSSMNITAEFPGRTDDHYIVVHVLRPPSGYKAKIVDDDSNAVASASSSTVSFASVDDTIAIDGVIGADPDGQWNEPGEGGSGPLADLSGEESFFGSTAIANEDPMAITWEQSGAQDVAWAHVGLLLGSEAVAEPSNPEVTSVDPDEGEQGEDLPVSILGSGFEDGANAAFGAGVTVQSVTFVSATELTAQLAISGGATPGPRSVTVTNPDDESDTLADGFTVTEAAAPPAGPARPQRILRGRGRYRRRRIFDPPAGSQ